MNAETIGAYPVPQTYQCGQREARVERAGKSTYRVVGTFGVTPYQSDDLMDAHDAAILFVFHGVDPMQRKTLTRLRPIGG